MAPASTEAGQVAPGHCPDVEVLFARGTRQPPGVGRVGEPFAAAIVRGLPGRSVEVRPVDYPADSSQTYERGTEDIVAHLRVRRRLCARTRVVLGGYSQGALAVSSALGAPLRGSPPPADLDLLDRAVVAAVLFGSPLEARSPSSNGVSSRFVGRTESFCADRDAVCGGRGPLPGSHRDYPTNGSTDAAAAFVLDRLTR